MKIPHLRIKLKHIESFIAVVEARGINEAALRLHVSKSAVSKRISELEELVQVELLHRSPRGVTPTSSGEAFYQKLRGVAGQIEDALQALEQNDDDLQGTLRIAAPVVLATRYINPVMYGLANRHPRLQLAVELDDRYVDLLAEGYDLAIRVGRLQTSSLAARLLASSRRVVCCSPAYAEQHGLPATPMDLVDHSCIGYSNVPPSVLWQFETDDPNESTQIVPVRQRLVVNNGEGQRDAAIAGGGITMVPLFVVADAIRKGELINALPGHRPITDQIYALFPQTQNPSRAVRQVIDLLVDSLSPIPPWERDLPESFAMR
ncbi:MAG: LysR family transcriptional regulator [Lysobacter sp.]